MMHTRHTSSSGLVCENSNLVLLPPAAVWACCVGLLRIKIGTMIGGGNKSIVCDGSTYSAICNISIYRFF